ncbi:GNAT family N-acetyltransferase [Nesterenkonia halophila]|uniref:GNAT family N-acetyltransferase n=1 Tax=Nesterenkonia halophila TaxID=302044 RepID=UPI001290C5DF|nr:GNAT family N-acetyltransferase [Nesterenkonia halophila]
MNTSERDPHVTLRAGRGDDAAALSAVAMRSKAYWGYSSAFLDACRDELTVTPELIADSQVTVAEILERVVGFSRVAGAPPSGELAALFVDHDTIGTGVGRRLLEEALSSAAERGFSELTFTADPGAASFYAAHGAETIGRVPSESIAGRELPWMRFTLT